MIVQLWSVGEKIYSFMYRIDCRHLVERLGNCPGSPLGKVGSFLRLKVVKTEKKLQATFLEPHRISEHQT